MALELLINYLYLMNYCVFCAKKLLCDGWCRAQCEKVTDEVLLILQRENIHWYGIRCNKGLGALLKVLWYYVQDYSETRTDWWKNEGHVKNVNRLQTLIQGNSDKLSLLKADVQTIRNDQEKLMYESMAAKDSMRQATQDFKLNRRTNGIHSLNKRWQI